MIVKNFINANGMQVISSLNNAGFLAYAVGGSVRNSVIGIAIHDIDIATDATASDVLKLFNHFPTKQVGKSFGTCIVYVNGENIEVTTFRTDGDYKDNRKPKTVEFVSNIEQDLARRDFTMNALAYHPNGQLIDLYGGLSDIKNKKIVAVGNPFDRINEDVLRILRAIRFASELGFSLDDNLKQACKLSMKKILSLSKERIIIEIKKLLLGKFCKSVVEEYFDIIELSLCGVQRLNKTHDQDLLKLIGQLPLELDIRLSFFMICCKIPCEDIFGFLKLDNKLKQSVRAIVNGESQTLQKNKSFVKWMMNKYSCDIFKKIIEIKALIASHEKNQDSKQKAEFILSQIDSIIQFNECYQISSLAVNGHDLMGIGIYLSEIKSKLNKILELVIENKIKNDKNEIISAIKRGEI